MHIKNEEVRTLLIYRALREFMIGLSIKEFEDFNTWVLDLMEQNKGIKTKLPTEELPTEELWDNSTKIEQLYKQFVHTALEPSGVAHNQRRKLIRMLDAVKDSVRTAITENYATTVEFKMFSKTQLTLLADWLMAVFYHNYDAIQDIITRFQHLAYVLVVLANCKEDTLMKIVLHNIAEGGTLLKTIYTGGLRNATDW